MAVGDSYQGICCSSYRLVSYGNPESLGADMSTVAGSVESIAMIISS